MGHEANAASRLLRAVAHLEEVVEGHLAENRREVGKFGDAGHHPNTCDDAFSTFERLLDQTLATIDDILERADQP
ncbi:MAG: hypothetical protein AAF986_01405 [Pseudomonadota bacterium]